MIDFLDSILDQCFLIVFLQYIFQHIRVVVDRFVLCLERYSYFHLQLVIKLHLMVVDIKKLFKTDGVRKKA